MRGRRQHWDAPKPDELAHRGFSYAVFQFVNAKVDERAKRKAAELPHVPYRRAR